MLRFPVEVSRLPMVQKRRSSVWSSPVTSSTNVKRALSSRPSHPSTSPEARRRLPLAQLSLRTHLVPAAPWLGTVSLPSRRWLNGSRTEWRNRSFLRRPQLVVPQSLRLLRLDLPTRLFSKIEDAQGMARRRILPRTSRWYQGPKACGIAFPGCAALTHPTRTWRMHPSTHPVTHSRSRVCR
jgi:hypothetical protein